MVALSTLVNTTVAKAASRCPRCRRRHRIELRTLSSPAGEFTLYGTCGRTNEPVFARQIPQRLEHGRPVKGEAGWEFI